LLIGTFYGTYGGNSYANGTIDEIAIYNRTLSATEIQNKYQLSDDRYYWEVNATDVSDSNVSSAYEFIIDSKRDVYFMGDSILTGWFEKLDQEGIEGYDMKPDGNSIVTGFGGATLNDWVYNETITTCNPYSNHWNCINNSNTYEELDYLVVNFYGNNMYSLNDWGFGGYLNSEGEGDVDVYIESFLEMVDSLVDGTPGFPNTKIIFMTYHPWDKDGLNATGDPNSNACDSANGTSQEKLWGGLCEGFLSRGATFDGGKYLCPYINYSEYSSGSAEDNATIVSLYRDCATHANQNFQYMLDNIEENLTQRGIPILDVFGEMREYYNDDTDQFLEAYSTDDLIHFSDTEYFYYDNFALPLLNDLFLNAPNISSVVAGSITTNSVNISFATTEISNYSINYGDSLSLGSINSSANYSKTPNLLLSSLSADTTYYYNVTVCDIIGNCNTTGTYSFTTEAETTTETTSSSSTGGSPSYSVGGSELSSGYTKSLGRLWKLNFKSNGDSHQLKVDKLDGTVKTATITVSSDPQTKTLEVGEEWKVNLDDDNDYDLLVRLDDVTSIRAEVFMQEIDEAIESAAEEASEEVVDGPVDDVNEEKGFCWGYVVWPILVIVVIIVVILLIKKKSKKKSKKK